MNASVKNYQDTMIKSAITAIVTAIVVGFVARWTLMSTLDDQMIKMELRVQQLEERYVEKNEFTPVSGQVSENKDRINENGKQLQAHEVTLKILTSK